MGLFCNFAKHINYRKDKTMENSNYKANATCGCKSTCKCKRKWIVAIVIIAALSILALTTPGKNTHKKAITKEIKTAITQAAKDRGLTDKQLGLIGQATENGLTHVYLENTLKIDNYLFFNLGTIDRNNNAGPMSIGFLGQVMLLRAQDIHYGVNRALDVDERLLEE